MGGMPHQYTCGCGVILMRASTGRHLETDGHRRWVKDTEKKCIICSRVFDSDDDLSAHIQRVYGADLAAVAHDEEAAMGASAAPVSSGRDRYDPSSLEGESVVRPVAAQEAGGAFVSPPGKRCAACGDPDCVGGCSVAGELEGKMASYRIPKAPVLRF